MNDVDTHASVDELAGWLGVPVASIAELPDAVRSAIAIRLTQSRRQAELVADHDQLAARVRSMAAYLQDQARIDPLTGLANRRAVEDRLTEEGDRTDRYADPVAVFVLDVDGLGHVNRKYGRQAGDALLRELAARLRWAVRSSDYVGRLGGDEFVVICPQMDESQAMKLAPALGRRVGGGAVPEYNEVGIAVSVGWTVRRPGATVDSIDVLCAADERLAAHRFHRASEGRGPAADLC